MTTYHDLTGFQRDLLEAIAAVEDDPYGLALKDYRALRRPDQPQPPLPEPRPAR
jgi:hypothetical protein